MTEENDPYATLREVCKIHMRQQPSPHWAKTGA